MLTLAPSVFDTRIVLGHLDGVAGRGEVAGLLAIDAIPALRTDSRQRVIQIVIQKLPPLHDHVSDFVVLFNDIGRNQGRGHETRARQFEPVVLSFLVPSDGRTEAVLVNRGCESN